MGWKYYCTGRDCVLRSVHKTQGRYKNKILFDPMSEKSYRPRIKWKNELRSYKKKPVTLPEVNFETISS